jgi:UTP--glucose-1-phosphate uridylyltransferase
VRVVIPAAGLGTRFSSQGLRSPKELLRLGDKPLLGHALVEAARAGFEAATVVLSPVKHQLRQFLADGTHPLPVEIVVQPEALGIGDAVLRCWKGEPFAVLLPDDVVLDTDHWPSLVALHHEYGAATLCVRPVPWNSTHRFGIAECDGELVVGLVEKPPQGAATSNLAIFGRYVVTEPVIAGLRTRRTSGELELTYGFAAAINTPPGVRVVRFSGEIYDCGTPDTYASSLERFPC